MICDCIFEVVPQRNPSSAEVTEEDPIFPDPFEITTRDAVRFEESTELIAHPLRVS